MEFLGKRLVVIGEHIGETLSHGHWIRHEICQGSWFRISHETVALTSDIHSVQASFLVYSSDDTLDITFVNSYCLDYN
jgi:hypothetical protein